MAPQEPRTYEPGGKAHADYLATHGGREYTGGPVCWDPRVSCEGACRVCPREAEQQIQEVR